MPEIHGLRAVAVLLVVLYHARIPGLPGGFIGVDVFFVISGYLITGLLIRELERSNRINLPQFYARRIRRLLPAAGLVLTCTLVLAWLVYAPMERGQFATGAFATALYVSNFWFAYLSTDYLAGDTHWNPVLHTWSLAVEEQFYLFWPLLLLIVSGKARSAIRRKRLMIAIVSVCAASFALSVLLTDYAQPWAFFSSPTRAWEFGLGGLFALLPLHAYRISPSVADLLGCVGILCILGAATSFSVSTPFPGFAAILPVLGACIVIGVSSGGGPSLLSRFLHTKPMQFCGDVSYSWYLWHWPVLTFMQVALNDQGFAWRLVGVLLSLFLAWITFVYVENPVRFSPGLARRVRLSLAAGALISFSSASLALMVRQQSMSDMEEDPQRRYYHASKDRPGIYANGCHAGLLETTANGCVYGDPKSNKTVVLFGDSHAAHWFPALEQLALKRNWRLLSLTKSGCPSVVFEPFSRQLGRQYTECTTWREQVFRRLEEERPALVIMANSSGYLSTASQATGTVATPNVWRRAVGQAAARLNNASVPVLLIRDTPRLAFDVPTCLARASWRRKDTSRVCGFSLHAALPTIAYEAEVLGLSRGGHMLDMTSAVCGRSRCETEQDGLVLYSDSHHLTAAFSRSLADELFSRIPRPIRAAL